MQRLYRDCYKVARGAPQEFQLLVGEVSTLSNSLNILQEEVKDPDSALIRAGEDRVRMVNEMVKNIAVTLKSLEKVAKKYEILGSSSKRKLIWAKFKWSVEFTSIDGLRNKLVYHNTVMNLLLTSVGNSSLQRIESSTDALEKDVREIKSYIAGQQIAETQSIPSISASDDDSEALSLSASLMKHAEMLQPWSTIGVDQWIESGRWWLLRAQLELASLEPGQEVPLAPYTSLIKASWILIDIISCHPQVPFLSASAHSEVQVLSAELKSEFQKLKSLQAVIPGLRELESQDLRIWETQSRGLQLRPQKGVRGSKASVAEDLWRVEGGEESLFQSFGMLKAQALPDPISCFILFLVNGENNEIRVWAQIQNGSGILAMSLENEVRLAELDGCDVMLNNEQITFASPQDAQMLCSLVEGANFYKRGTLDLGRAMEDMKALALIFAVKAQRRETAARLLEKLPSSESNDDIDSEGLVLIASNLARQQANGTLNEMLCDENNTPRNVLPLYQWAIECNHVELATFLISKQIVDTEGGSWRGMHPMYLACHCGYEAIAKRLLHDANRRNSNGDWPLHAAAAHGYTSIVRLLLRNGADVDARNNGGLTPLNMSARNGHEKTVQLLVDRGANLGNRSAGRFTPLQEACDTAQEKVIAILIEEGSDCTAPKHDGLTPYHLSLDRGVSRPTFDMIASKYYSQSKRTPNIPQARAKVTWVIDSDWATLWLDSPATYFVHPDPLPGNVQDTHQHLIKVGRPVGEPNQFWKWTYECDIVYSTDDLHFSIGHGSLGTTHTRGNTVFTVAVSQDNDTPPISHSVETRDRGGGINFGSHHLTLVPPVAQNLDS